MTDVKMINTESLGRELKKYGFNIYCGVPCSFLSYLINYGINNCNYIMATNEGDAVSISAGLYLSGKKSILLMQNSGLTNALSPLTSLNNIFKIPVFGFISLRGGISDEPQHELMGLITTDMLDLIGIKWEYLSYDLQEAKNQISYINKIFEHNHSFFFIVRKGTFETEELSVQHSVALNNNIKKVKIYNDQIPSRSQVLETISKIKDNKTLLLATTGKTGRELYEINDTCNNFYMVGSMGCVSSIALGLALAREDKDIIAIDGDGSLLMRMGSLGTAGYYNPANMLHILLDNNSYDSTGGQMSVSSHINFVDIAFACGYNAVYIHNLEELYGNIYSWKKDKKLTFLYMKIAKGSAENLKRPELKPYEIKERLMNFIQG
jgi:phosphonopyruvate decarboxylase